MKFIESHESHSHEIHHECISLHAPRKISTFVNYEALLQRSGNYLPAASGMERLSRDSTDTVGEKGCGD